MAREHPDYRDNLELLNRRFPEHDMLNVEELMQITGIKTHRTVNKHFKGGIVGGRISKVKVARWMCGMKM